MQTRATKSLVTAATSVVLGSMIGPSSQAGEAVDLAAASKQFLNSCGVCHTVEPNAEIRQGPNLRTVYGRKAGALAEFATYSDALKAAGGKGLVWSDEALDKWIDNSAAFIPGAMMPYAQPDAAKRQLVIAYLKSLGAAGGSDPPKP